MTEEDIHENKGALKGHAGHVLRMNGKITDLERELMAEKPWALRGEVHSTDRPQNRCVISCSGGLSMGGVKNARCLACMMEAIAQKFLVGTEDDGLVLRVT